MWDPLQCMVTSSSEPLEAFAVPNAPASVMASVFLSSLCSSDFSIYSIYTFSIFTPTPSPFTASPLTPLTCLYQHTIISKLLPFFYCSYISLVPYFHKLLFTQHKPRGRRNHLSQKQAQPDTTIRYRHRHRFENPILVLLR